MLEKKNSRWEESISLSKQDKLYKDAMITAAVSASTEVAEELLSYFVDIGNKQGVLRSALVHLFRFASVRYRGGAVLAAWPERLLHAVQNSSTALTSRKGEPF